MSLENGIYGGVCGHNILGAGLIDCEDPPHCIGNFVEDVNQNQTSRWSIIVFKQNV